jgi:hypothetical protein
MYNIHTRVVCAMHSCAMFPFRLLSRFVAWKWPSRMKNWNMGTSGTTDCESLSLTSAAVSFSLSHSVNLFSFQFLLFFVCVWFLPGIFSIIPWMDGHLFGGLSCHTFIFVLFFCRGKWNSIRVEWKSTFVRCLLTTLRPPRWILAASKIKRKTETHTHTGPKKGQNKDERRSVCDYIAAP